MPPDDVTPPSVLDSSWVQSGPPVLPVATSPATCAPQVRRVNKSIGGRFGKCPAPYVASHGEERPDLDARQFGPACEEFELKQHDDACHFGARLPDKLGGSGRGAAGRQHGVDDENAIRCAKCIGMYLERGRSVLEFVRLRVGLA